MTQAELKTKLKGIPKDRQAAVVCSLIGHSRIVDGFMGEVYCGRCDAKIADQWTSGYRQAEESVRIGHNCDTCHKNHAKMGWRDKFMVPDPFKQRELAAKGDS